MEYKRLGSTDFEISRIGLGCWAIGGHGYGNVDDRESIKAIQKALDMGVNFFDTADVYGFGHSEEILSKALGSQRDKVIVATKFGVNWDENGKTYKDCSPKRIVEALDGIGRRTVGSQHHLEQHAGAGTGLAVGEAHEMCAVSKPGGKIIFGVTTCPEGNGFFIQTLQKNIRVQSAAVVTAIYD